MNTKKRFMSELRIVKEKGGLIDIKPKEKKGIYDYDEKKKLSEATALRTSLKNLEALSLSLIDESVEDSKKISNEIYNYVLELVNSVKQKDREKVEKISKKIENALMDVETKHLEIESIKNLPGEIIEEVNEDLEEMEKCFQVGAYKSAIIMCGRILEVALHRKYYEITKKDLLETAPGLGLGKIIKKLVEANVKMPAGLKDQIHLINKVRIESVHKKKKPFRPTKDQTRAIILYTKDVVKRMF